MAAIARTHVFTIVSFPVRETEMPFAGYSAIRKHFGDCLQRNVALKRKGNAVILPKIRAQIPPGANAYPI